MKVLPQTLEHFPVGLGSCVRAGLHQLDRWSAFSLVVKDFLILLPSNRIKLKCTFIRRRKMIELESCNILLFTAAEYST